MTQSVTPRSETKAQRRYGWLIFLAFMASVPAIFALAPGAVNLAAIGDVTWRAPDWRPFLSATTLVQIHLVTVAVALALGPVQFALPKGTRTHRVVGWIWVASMLITAVVTLFIHDMRGGTGFSPIHLFSVMTLVGVPLAIWAARAGDIAGHTRAMIGLYIGLIIAGVTAIAPGRLIWAMFFS